MSEATPVEKLRTLIERELDRPRPFEQVARELPNLLTADPQLAETLRLLATADRERFWIKSEATWFRRFGWRLMRPMLATGLLAAGVFFFGDISNRARAFLMFLLGAGSFYVVLQLYIHRWSATEEKKLAESQRTLREQLQRVLAELDRQR
ncbi:MAG: hypothetical protein JSV80_15735 [Acidobacteriota bacterium]|nr:MAG: hypothetical protein JSV80_15735 [Acidobacteriota bacterium]